MNIKFDILFRACDKVESVHNAKRLFGMNKIQTIKISFISLYRSLENYDAKFTIIGDDLSREMLDFFDNFDSVKVLNGKYGSAAKSLKKQLELAYKAPDENWVYLCEDDYLHTPYSFKYIEEFISSKKHYLQTSGKKKNLLNKFIGDLSNLPLIVHPPDYPDRYLSFWKRPSYIFLSKYCHWRQISNTTHTILAKAKTIKKYRKYFDESAIGPSDTKLSEKVYGRLFFLRKKTLCVSPIQGLSTHMQEGVVTPFVDWEKYCHEYIQILEELKAWND